MKTRILSFALFLFVVLTSSARSQSSREKIVITYPSRSIASGDVYIAQECGFFRQENLQAEVVQVRGNIGVAALLSGDAHAINNFGTIIRAMERTELPAKVVRQSLKKCLLARHQSRSKIARRAQRQVFGTTTFKIFNFSLQREVNRESGIK